MQTRKTSTFEAVWRLIYGLLADARSVSEAAVNVSPMLEHLLINLVDALVIGAGSSRALHDPIYSWLASNAEYDILVLVLYAFLRLEYQ